VLLGLSGVGGVFNEQVITFYNTILTMSSSSVKYIQQLKAIDMFENVLFGQLWTLHHAFLL
jgi:hypothetical protein